jgi:hypothetical protein
MMVANPDDESSRIEQHNHGPGAFVGGNNYGTINTIDKTTQAILKKLSSEAPALAQLLQKALQDGVVSPDVVRALEFAARNINEDVANALRIAGRNINEDVAWNLRSAGEKISGALERYERIADAFDSMVQPYGEDSLTSQLDKTVNSIRLHADRIESVFAPPPPQIITNWKATVYAFLIGLVVGVVALAYAMHH